MSFFLVFLAIAVAGVAAAAAVGKLPGRFQWLLEGRGRGALPPAAPVPAPDAPEADWRRGQVAALEGLSEHEARLPAVLLPEHPRSEDIDSIRFSTALRGYRMDQVDQVLDALRAELAAKEALIRTLARSGNGSGRHAAVEEQGQ
ncbi:DivIVA domain-containing protein [Arthrobacter mobilis]|uniref:DivIVA domain-containing protein n=1 Tax=Arthrobacter mobilis TaxID=2724944 RepID=A0A7X6K533_9MICC|nr:DivIVA domain-containing protein [Arthrobacter mobilis]NKX53754.1 DivIVA domain-containing protein [Arthrobacter mobilis]